MKSTHRPSVIAAALVFSVSLAALLALASVAFGDSGTISAQAPRQNGCNLATLGSNYGVSFHGFSIPGGGGDPVPVAGVGLVTFDGAGNLSGIETVSLGGVIFPQTSLSGTYTVNSDCTGSQTINFAPGGSAHLNFAIVDNGKEILAVATNPGGVAIDTFKRQ